MSRLCARVIAAVGVAVLALAVSQSSLEATVAIGIALTAFGMLAVMRLAVGIARTPEVGVGGRSRAHRESLAEFAAPGHPRTPGRRRSRAPSEASVAA
ncbi:MAG: hypothetical protein ACOH19_12830 [Rhodoglobus sp.]